MKLYVLRHGESLANVRQLVCGSQDFPLSARGVLQAKCVCEFLSTRQFTRVYASSLSRAIHTVSDLRCQPPILVQSQLVELNTGLVSMLSLPELWAQDIRFKQPWLTPELRYPGGECFREMVERISGWFENAARQWSEEDRVLIVGHEGTLRVIFLRLFGLDLEQYPDFPIGNCDHLYFDIRQDKIVHYAHVTLQSLGGDCHEESAADNIS